MEDEYSHPDSVMTVKPKKGKGQTKDNSKQQIVWDVQEDMQDILSMIPDEYKKPLR